jgi:hypothetical protein
MFALASITPAMFASPKIARTTGRLPVSLSVAPDAMEKPRSATITTSVPPD